MNRKHLHSLMRNPKLLLVGLLSARPFAWIPDSWYLKVNYRCRTGLSLNLENPRRFNEKLQWLKLHDRQPIYTTCVDKYAVRAHVGRIIGEEYLIPIYGVWDSVDEIDFAKLPEKCVLKCTHDSGSVAIIDKNTDKATLKKKLKKWLSHDYYIRGREWPYKDVKHRVICEKFMQNAASEGLTDYKFFCFHGEPKLLIVCTERTEMGPKVTFMDMDWEKLPFERHYPASDVPIKKPANFELMIQLSKKLAAGFPFVRVDLYEIRAKVYFGELTLYPGGGFEEFKPDEWDEKLGALIDISKVKRTD